MDRARKREREQKTDRERARESESKREGERADLGVGIPLKDGNTFFDGYCNTVQCLLDWFEVVL